MFSFLQKIALFWFLVVDLRLPTCVMCNMRDMCIVHASLTEFIFQRRSRRRRRSAALQTNYKSWAHTWCKRAISFTNWFVRLAVEYLQLKIDRPIHATRHLCPCNVHRQNRRREMCSAFSRFFCSFLDGSVADRELGVCLYSHQSVRQTMKESNIVYIIIICEWFWLRNWYGKWCTTISWTILRKCSGEMCQRAKRIVFAHTKTYRNLLRDRINYWKCDTAWDVVCLPCLVLPANARIYL